MFTTLGHQKQKDFLQRQIERQNYSQSYLFSGPGVIGKRHLAIEFAMAIIGSPIEKIENTPDLLRADAAELSISEMRGLLSMLALAPFSGSKKVLVIDNFEQASKEVSNALLKTLEEPNQTTVIILVTNNYKALLPTIVSRTQLLHFSTLQEKELAEMPHLKQSQRFNGRIGKAIRYANDSEYAAQFDSSTKELQAMKKTAPAERLLGIKKLAELENQQLRELFDNWLDIEQAALPSHPQNYKNLNLLAAAMRDINRNINKKLILQKVLLELTA